jgi:RNA polymerase sigma factor (sigma-70 family)
MPPTARHLPARLAFGPALRMQSDRRLVGLVRAGDERAFEEIVRRYRRPLDRFAASIVGAAADDVTQDSFRKALESLRHAEADVELRPWLFRIVRNTALNDLRDRPPAAAELAEELIAGGRSAAAEAEQRAELQDLTAQLKALPENQRAALVMRELEGMGHEEIATALGISDGAARQAIARARAAIRSGFGALIPLPLLRVLAGGADGAAGPGSAAGGGAIAAGAGGIAAGALKVGLATVVVAGTIGAGVAIEQHGGGHASSERQSVAAAPHRRQAAAAPTRVTPSLAPLATAASKRSTAAKSGAGGDGHRSGHQAHHQSGRGQAAGNGPHLVPVAQPTTVAAAEPGGHSEGGGPGPGHHSSGHDGSEGGSSGDGHQGPGGSGHQGSSEGGGDHQGSGGDHGSFGGGDGSTNGESSGSGTSDGRTSGSSTGDDSSGDGGTVPTGTQTANFSDDGSSSGGDDATASSNDGGDSGAEPGATPESALPSAHEPLPEGASEPSP